MMFFHHSSGLVTGDCLGGRVSQHRVKPTYARIKGDTMECLEILNSNMIFDYSMYYKINKTGDSTFEFWFYSVVAPNGVLLGGTEINVGESIILDIELKNYYIELARTRAGNDTGVLLLDFPVNMNAPWARPNLDVTDLTPYYALVYLRLEEDTYIDNITGEAHYFSGISTMNDQIIANHLTEPSGVSWSTGPEHITVIESVLPAGYYPLWLRNIDFQNPSIFVYTNDPDTGIELTGLFQVPKDATKKRYQIYGAYDGSKTDGTLLGESDTLPIDVVLTPPGSGTREYRFRLVEQTKYGVQSQNVLLDQIFTIDSEGENQTKPSPPDWIMLTVLNGGRIKVTTKITQPFIGERIVLAKIMAEGETTFMEVVGSGEYDSIIGPFTWGETIEVEVSLIDALLQESSVVDDSVLVVYEMGSTPESIINQKSSRTGTVSVFDGLLNLSDGDAFLFGEGGKGTQLILGDEVVLEIANNEIVSASGWVLKNETVSGASSKYLEDAGSGIYYLGNGTTRRVKFDTVNKIISAKWFKQPLDFQCPLPGPVEEYDGKIRFQYLDNKYATWLYLDGEDVYTINWRQT